MNDLNPLTPGGADPLDPTAGGPKPWEKQPPSAPPAQDGGSSAADGSGLAEGAVEVGGAMADVAGGAVEAVGSVAGGCADGCGGCSAAILARLFAVAGTAMALTR